MAERKPISKKRRFEVFKRDGFTCAYCGSTPPKVILHVDHIHPVALGGGNDPDNLVTSCLECNLGKGKTPLASVPESLSAKAALVQEREDQLSAFSETMRKAKARKLADAWEVADVIMIGFGDDSIRKDWLKSIESFVEQLGVVCVVDAMEIAVNRKNSKSAAFKYFCGICWNKVRESA